MRTTDRRKRIPATHVVDSLVDARPLADTDGERALTVVTEASLRRSTNPVAASPRWSSLSRAACTAWCWPSP